MNQHSLQITQAPANHVSQPNLLDAYLPNQTELLSAAEMQLHCATDVAVLPACQTLFQNPQPPESLASAVKKTQYCMPCCCTPVFHMCVPQCICTHNPARTTTPSHRPLQFPCSSPIGLP